MAKISQRVCQPPSFRWVTLMRSLPLCTTRSGHSQHRTRCVTTSTTVLSSISRELVGKCSVGRRTPRQTNCFCSRSRSISGPATSKLECSNSISSNLSSHTSAASTTHKFELGGIWIHIVHRLKSPTFLLCTTSSPWTHLFNKDLPLA